MCQRAFPLWSRRMIQPPLFRFNSKSLRGVGFKKWSNLRAALTGLLKVKEGVFGCKIRFLRNKEEWAECLRDSFQTGLSLSPFLVPYLVEWTGRLTSKKSNKRKEFALAELAPFSLARADGDSWKAVTRRGLVPEIDCFDDPNGGCRSMPLTPDFYIRSYPFPMVKLFHSLAQALSDNKIISNHQWKIWSMMHLHMI